MSKYISAYAAFEIGDEVYFYEPSLRVVKGVVSRINLIVKDSKDTPEISYDIATHKRVYYVKSEAIIGNTAVHAINKYFDAQCSEAIAEHNKRQEKEKAANELANASSTGA